MRRFLAIVLGAAASALAQAQPDESHRLAQALVVRSGLAEQLKSLPRQLELELRLARGPVPDEVLAALTEAAKESFDPRTLREDVMLTLARGMTVADMSEALAWLETPLGRRVTRAEERSAATLTPQALQAFAEGPEKKPLGERRARLISELVAATKGVEHAANLTEGVARLRSSLPPEVLREQIAASVPTVYAYVYREVAHSDLGAYVRFSRSPLGVRYTDAVMAAFTGAMLRASLRMGPAIERSLQRKPA